MSDNTRVKAAPARRRVRLTVRVGAAGAFVLLALSGAGALGGDTQPDLVGADFSRHSIEASEPTRSVEARGAGCVYDERYLPRTPDAVEAWYRNCRSDMRGERECQFNPKYLPRTPDAAEAWHRSCLSGVDSRP